MDDFGDFSRASVTTASPAPDTAADGKRFLRVWMVDDNDLFREGFAQLLSARPRLRVTQQFSSIQPMLEALAEERPPDIILLDLHIGKENGLSAIVPAKKLAPGVNVLMLTTFSNTYAEAEAFDLGARGFLLKIYEPDEIVALIRQACCEPRDPRLFPHVADRASRDSANPANTPAATADHAAGFFGALRQLCRPRRRQPAD